MEFDADNFKPKLIAINALDLYIYIKKQFYTLRLKLCLGLVSTGLILILSLILH